MEECMARDNLSCPDGTCGNKFSYCFWAKLLVAIPAIPLLALLAASAFDTAIAQLAAAAAAVAGTLWLAVRVDKLPALSGMVRPNRKKTP
jgi:hypothetical protein